MIRLILFYANSDCSDENFGTLERRDELGSRRSSLLAEHFSFDGAKPPEKGYRLKEFKTNELGVSTHSRLSPWTVDSVETYFESLPVGHSFEEVVICFCKRVALDDSDRQWKSVFDGGAVVKHS